MSDHMMPRLDNRLSNLEEAMEKEKLELQRWVANLTPQTAHLTMQSAIQYAHLASKVVLLRSIKGSYG